MPETIMAYPIGSNDLLPFNPCIVFVALEQINSALPGELIQCTNRGIFPMYRNIIAKEIISRTILRVYQGVKCPFARSVIPF
ncbi:hypothetical protein LDC_0642 [sediment metagenome]|uniref:Uncharacterized protein n=1 Tax=sediment metagenome TaxID=749907 RepID=D9PGJ5_9ZZZZ